MTSYKKRPRDLICCLATLYFWAKSNFGLTCDPVTVDFTCEEQTSQYYIIEVRSVY